MFAAQVAPRAFAAPAGRAGAPRRPSGARAARVIRAPASAAPPSPTASDADAFAVADMPATELDPRGVERVTLQTEGWSTWTWKGHACNYISAGGTNEGPIVVLVHGFGAHSYHWRYTIPALARRGFRVYALCMLGYGWSPKVEAPYSMEFWGEQVIAFAKEVACASESDKAVIAGNSIGALAALYAAANAPEATRGLCLVNSAGNFAEGAKPGPEKKTLAQKAVGQTKSEIRDPTDAAAAANLTFAERAQESFGKLVSTAIFFFTKVRIKSILQQVYESEPDADLVRSIELAAEDPGAIDTFYQLSLAGGRTKITAGDLLEKYQGPLMLLWGEKDPWMTPTKAERIMEIKPEAYYAPVVAGHCPHDDAPVECSAKLGDWAEGLAA
jgi:pimeloyl-ACP methyl ester carboxylesterase